MTDLGQLVHLLRNTPVREVIKTLGATGRLPRQGFP